MVNIKNTGTTLPLTPPGLGMESRAVCTIGKHPSYSATSPAPQQNTRPLQEGSRQTDTGGLSLVKQRS